MKNLFDESRAYTDAAAVAVPLCEPFNLNENYTLYSTFRYSLASEIEAYKKYNIIA